MPFDGKTPHEFLVSLMKAKEKEIRERFWNLSKDAQRIYPKDPKYRSLECVYIPGTRDDRVLLVAHCDTVWHDGPVQPKIVGNMIASGNRKRGFDKKLKMPYVTGLGIGADDRAGVAALLELADLGHSLLLTGEEETGCRGSMMLIGDPKTEEELQKHQFAVQFDRKGKKDAVFYDVGTDKFSEYIWKQTGHIEKLGSYSDIAVLCTEICGVNLSIGYKNEHTPNEVQNVRWFLDTLENARKMLSKKKLPQFLR